MASSIEGWLAKLESRLDQIDLEPESWFACQQVACASDNEQDSRLPPPRRW
jgi:hypothetical protein